MTHKILLRMSVALLFSLSWENSASSSTLGQEDAAKQLLDQNGERPAEERKARVPQLTARQMAKYNTPKITCYHFDDAASLRMLRDKYHELTIPEIIPDILFERDSVGMDMLRNRPSTFTWSDSGDFLLEINPGQMPFEEWKNADLAQLKYREAGLAVIGWYIHPNLLKGTPFENNYVLKNRTPLPYAPEYVEKTFLDVENTGDAPRFLVTILDLTEKDIPYLEKAKKMALDKLASTYKVDPKEDKVRLYFHFPYAQETVTLHLHARVNQAMHQVEATRSFSIDELIEGLKAHRSVEEIILERQAQDHLNDASEQCIYANYSAQDILDKMNVPGVSRRIVDNHLLIQ